MALNRIERIELSLDIRKKLEDLEKMESPPNRVVRKSICFKMELEAEREVFV